MRTIAFAVLLVLAVAAPSRANDSTAALDAGGLRLTHNPDIEMESERLFLSRNEVRVVYRFRNKSGRDIGTLVAFPLPAMEIGETGNYALDGRDPVNIMDFEVTVDGKRVSPSVEIKATRFGVDVTAVLQRRNIPVTMLPGKGETGDALNERLNTMPAEARRDLERHGLIDWNTSFGAGDKPLANVHWNAHLTYYWFQTFPAGRAIEVTHRYRPVPRQFFFTKAELDSAETRKAFCMDPGFVRGVQARLQKAPNTVLAGTELKYVLTTAGNWMGPIGRFELTIDKGSPDALVSFCGEGVRRIGPTTFTLAKDNFSPSEDLRILFLGPVPQ
ncbi:MAG: DUF4424 family protein [Pseudolabrys sp.]